MTNADRIETALILGTGILGLVAIFAVFFH